MKKTPTGRIKNVRCKMSWVEDKMDKIWHGKWIMDPEFYGLAPINLFHKQNSKYCLPGYIDKLRDRHDSTEKPIF